MGIKLGQTSIYLYLVEIIFNNNKSNKVMKVNLNQKFKNFFGNEDSKNDTMKVSIAKALFSGVGIGNSDDEKFAAYKLCNRLINEKEDEMEFDKDERKLILSAACASLVPGAYGQVRELLNNGEE